MEYSTRKEKFNCLSAVFESGKEQPIDIDITLPDYCPDVRRVLKCKVIPQIMSKTISGDALTVDGNVIINILYCDSETDSVRCYEHNAAFSCNFTIKNPPSDYVILAKAKTEYVNCRALTSRRLDLHGAFNVSVRVLIKEQKEIVKGFIEDDLQQLENSTVATTLNAFGQQQISLSEATPLPQRKESIQSVLQKSMSVIIDDVKLLPEKAMVKGYAAVKLLYICEIETGKTESFEYNIPFNQIIDIQNGSEDSYYFVNTEMNSLNVSCVSENDNNTVNTDIKFTLTVFLFKDTEIKSVADAYSVKYDVDTVNVKMEIPQIVSEVKDTVIEKSCIDFGENKISSIIDLWIDSLIYNYEIRDGKPVLKGKMLVNILGLDGENQPFYVERAVESFYELPEDEFKNKQYEINSSIQMLTYRLNGDSGIEMRIDIKINFIAIANKSINLICNVTTDEQISNMNNNISFILYYSQNGEELWDIAKKYKITKKDIIDENELTQDKAEGGLLILPV